MCLNFGAQILVRLTYDFGAKIQTLRSKKQTNKKDKKQKLLRQKMEGFLYDILQFT